MTKNHKPKLLKNVICIGGFSGVGKSTLIERFFETGYPVSYEFHESSVNAILQILFQKYMKEEIDAFIMQAAFLNHSIDRYTTRIKEAKDKKPVFIDRTIVEDIFYARGQIVEKELLNIFLKIWEEKLELFKKEIGFPSIYFHIHLPFDVAMKRVFDRDPKEKEEKTRNIDKFRKIYTEYYDNMKKGVESLGIEYVYVDASGLSREELFTKCRKWLLDRNIINEFVE